MEKEIERPITICLLGPESSGKTWLVHELAKHFNSPFSEEYARPYLNAIKRKYHYDDLKQIASGQAKQNEHQLDPHSPFLFIDSNCITLEIWSRLKFNEPLRGIEKFKEKEAHQWLLLTSPNIAYEADQLRENPSQNERDEIFKHYHQELINDPKFLGTIDAPKKNRLEQAIHLINLKFSA